MAPLYAADHAPQFLFFGAVYLLTFLETLLLMGVDVAISARLDYLSYIHTL